MTTFSTRAAAPVSSADQGAGGGLVADGHRVRAGLAAAVDGSPVDAHEVGLEGRAVAGRERGPQGPVLAGAEGLDLALALDDQPHGHRLDAARREAAADLARDERAEGVADHAIDDAARLLGVDEVDVDRARMGEGLADGALGDLVEGHAALLGDGHAGRLGHVPGDGLTLAIEVGGQEDRLGRAAPPA